MTLPEAHNLASRLLEEIKPHCAQAHIAGSIRRKKPDGIKDVELVCVPKWEEAKAGLFAEDVTQENLLWKWAQTQTIIEWIKPGTNEIVKWDVRPEGKYWRGVFSNGVKLDLFLATPYNAGIILLIRTGSAEFSHRFVTPRSQGGTLPENLRVAGGYLRASDNTIIPTPTEESVFELTGRKFVPPEKRI